MERKTEAKPVHAQHGSCVTTTEWGTCSDVSTDGMGDLETTLDEDTVRFQCEVQTSVLNTPQSARWLPLLLGCPEKAPITEERPGRA